LETDEKSKPKRTTRYSKVALVRPNLDFTKPPEEQREAIREFARRFVRAMKGAPNK
jgi:hypothetical protein